MRLELVYPVDSVTEVKIKAAAGPMVVSLSKMDRDDPVDQVMLTLGVEREVAEKFSFLDAIRILNASVSLSRRTEYIVKNQYCDKCKKLNSVQVPLLFPDVKPTQGIGKKMLNDEEVIIKPVCCADGDLIDEFMRNPKRIVIIADKCLEGGFTEKHMLPEIETVCEIVVNDIKNILDILITDFNCEHCGENQVVKQNPTRGDFLSSL